MTSHRITNADNVRTGNAISADRTVLGVPLKNVVTESFAPVVAASTSVAASQAVLAATVAGALINGAVATLGVATFDVPRNVVAAWTGTAIITITGKDKYGVTIVEASASGTSHTGKKAFKSISKITTNADITGFTAGSGAILGLSYAPIVGGFVRGRFGEDTADAGTYAPPIRIAATSTTGDVRGTYAYAGTANGTNVFTVIYVAANGPQDTDAFGVAQFGG